MQWTSPGAATAICNSTCMATACLRACQPVSRCCSNGLPMPRGVFNRREQVTTVRIDADVLLWLKSNGKGYQTRINSILRDAMMHKHGVHDR